MSGRSDFVIGFAIQFTQSNSIVTFLIAHPNTAQFRVCYTYLKVTCLSLIHSALMQQQWVSNPPVNLFRVWSWAAKIVLYAFALSDATPPQKQRDMILGYSLTHKTDHVTIPNYKVDVCSLFHGIANIIVCSHACSFYFLL